ncbi:hypothetical protein [Acinetobacter baumannii]|uniref:hypothetical protein n=1 Tax=Acinetobacter baumannii TaxID=470 RepID=UPI003892B044
MSVPVQTPSKEYIANGTTTAFPLDFNCDKAEYLIVTLNGEDAPVGSWTLANDTVTFNVAPVNGVVINLQRNTPFQRATNYQLYDNSFRPSAVNKDFDLIWWKLQELGYRDQVIWLALVKEISDRIDGDEGLQNQINTIDEWLANLQQNVNENTNDIAQLVNDLSKEIADRIKGDQILKDMFLSMIDEAINEGTINALAITHVDSLGGLDAISNVWDGRTVYVKDLGNYRYDALTTSWVKAYQDADNLKDGAETQKQINEKTVQRVGSIDDLNDLDKWESRTVYVSAVGMYEVNNDAWVFKPTSAQYVVDNTGVTQQAINSKFVIPEMYGAKANDPDFDNTTALNSAFATGKDIYSTPDKTYYVNGILNSKGQKCIGGWSIYSNRSDGSASGKLGLIETTAEGVDAFSVRMLYVESAYDLTELFIIKSLGFNTINHYGYFENSPADVGGTVQKLLDNCLTAGLQVNLGTESSAAQSDINTFINNSQFHKALWGYSVYDEPASRGITVAQQDYKIDMLRSLTGKPLSFVDLIAFGGAFNQLFSTRYDIAFVDSYSLQYTTGTLADWLAKDLEKMRYDYGCIKAMTKIDRVYPVVGAYSMATYYANNPDQVVQASKIFGTIAEGNFGAFVWDGVGDAGIIDNVRKSQKYRNLVKDLASQKVRKKVNTDVYLFGGAPTSTDWGVNDLLSNLIIKDPFTTDLNTWGSAYPTYLKSGSSDTDHISTALNSGTSYSGLAMKGSYSSLPTSIKCRNYIRCVIEVMHVTTTTNGTFQLLSTADNGYTQTVRFEDGYSGNKVFNFTTTVNSNDERLILRIESANDTSTMYRKFLRGIIICSDW